MSGAKRAGIIGGTIGAVAAVAAVSVAVERYAVGRIRAGAESADLAAVEGEAATTAARANDRPVAAADPVAAHSAAATEDGDAFTAPVTDREPTVLADDGVPLHAEEVGPEDAALTIVFVHGFALALGSWALQRAALAGTPGVRLVFYDQRGHGRSARGPAAHSTFDQLGADLEAVLDQRVPTGPVVLVGHSMGGMTILALAERAPKRFGSQVVGVGLISTSAGRLTSTSPGLRAAVARSLRPVQYVASATLRRTPEVLAERTRRAGKDVSWLLTRRYGFGSRRVSPAIVGYVDAMIATTPVAVIGELLPAFTDHDKHAALPVLLDLPTVVLVGDRDLLTPVSHTTDIGAALPGAEVTVVAGAGHLLMLEQPELVTAAVSELIAGAVAQLPGPKRRGVG